MTVKRTLVGFGSLAAAALVAMPLLAQTAPGGKPGEEPRKSGEGTKGEIYFEQELGRPLADIEHKVNEAITKAGLTELTVIDWSRVSHKPGEPGRMESGKPGEKMDSGKPGEKMESGKPGEPTKHDEKAEVPLNKIRTYYIEDEECARRIHEAPEHALWVPAFVVYEKDGKAHFVCKKLAVLLTKCGDAAKAEKYMEHARELDRKIEQIAENLRAGKT